MNATAPTCAREDAGHAEHVIVRLADGTLMACEYVCRDQTGPGIVVDHPCWTTRMSVLPEQLVA